MKPRTIVSWALVACLGIAVWYSTCSCLEMVARATDILLRRSGGLVSVGGALFMPIFVEGRSMTFLLPSLLLFLVCACGAVLEDRGIIIPKITVLTVSLAINLFVVELGVAALVGPFG